MVESCQQPLTTLSFSMSFLSSPFPPPSLSLSPFSRECARSMCTRDRGASLGVVRIDEGPLIIIPSLRQDESCICIPAPLSFTLFSLSLSLFLIRSSYLSPSRLPFSLFLFLPSGVIPDRHGSLFLNQLKNS